MPTDYYKVLRVPHDASQTEIQKAHRDLARTYHPDANPDNSDNARKFQEIQEAFDALNDPEKREMYDRYGIPFDPYHRWLGIPKSEQPASRYRLLGLAAFEPDVGVISDAAEQRILHVRRRSRSLGENQQIASRIIHELMAAREHLLESQKKAAYDECLCQQMQEVSASANQCEGDASTAASSESSKWENAASNSQAEAPTAHAPVSARKKKPREKNPLVRIVGIVAMGLLAVPVAFGISRLLKAPADKIPASDSRPPVSSSDTPADKQDGALASAAQHVSRRQAQVTVNGAPVAPNTTLPEPPASNRPQPGATPAEASAASLAPGSPSPPASSVSLPPVRSPVAADDAAVSQPQIVAAQAAKAETVPRRAAPVDTAATNAKAESPATLIATWQHHWKSNNGKTGTGENRLYSDGHVESPGGAGTWERHGSTLVIHKNNAVITVTVSSDGRSYDGRSTEGGHVWGDLVSDQGAAKTGSPLDTKPMSADGKETFTYTGKGNTGRFINLDGKNWKEIYSDSDAHFDFVEVSRAGGVVELYDASRKMSVRIYSDRYEVKSPRKGRWVVNHHGSWSK